MANDITVGRPGQFAEFRRFSIQRMEKAALEVSNRAALAAQREIRSAMQGAGLGRLGNAIGHGSDLKKTGTVHRRGSEGFSASGWLYIRGRSPRTVGAIIAYTEGAQIRPVKSQWLWIATDEIPRRAGRYRMTPALYRQHGFEQRIGPLIQIPGRHAGEALLVARDVTVDRFGRRGRARRATKRLGSSREQRDQIVAFVGIRQTSRAARVDVRQIISAHAARIPGLIAAALAAPTS